MDWRNDLLDRIAAQPCAGYGRSDSPATEPSTLAALALAGIGRVNEARLVADWLARMQGANGSVGIRAAEAEPCWPTSLAILTWTAIHEFDLTRPFQASIDRSFNWVVALQGVKLQRHGEPGHDSMVAAWPWVDETHSWVEPTALNVLALKAIGQGSHSRTRDAVTMLINRQLPLGGLNYGNTIVLGRQLRPHVQPTGLALLALAGETSDQHLLQRSLVYLREQLGPSTTTSSLCWSLLALAAHQHVPEAAEEWLEAAYRRTIQRDQSLYKLALIALALQKDQSLLITLPARFRATTDTHSDRKS